MQDSNLRFPAPKAGDLNQTSLISDDLVPPDRIELPNSDYKTDVLPLELRGQKLGGPLEDRTPTSAVQRRRAPIITSSPNF